MSDFLVPLSILALIFVFIGAAYISNYVGNLGACKVIEAEKAKLREKRGRRSN